MDKLYNILYTSALETYDLVEKHKKTIVHLITMFLPKETREFILKKDFDCEYYSKSELKSIKKQKCKKLTNKKQQPNISANKASKRYKTPPINLSNSMNKSKIQFLIQHIPKNIRCFLIFFSYLSLHSIYFWSFFIILVFVTNTNYLLICLFISLINTSGIIIFSNCPISILERKYRNKLTHNQYYITNVLKKIYDNNRHHGYEDTIEELVCVDFLLFIKILLIILCNYFWKSK